MFISRNICAIILGLLLLSCGKKQEVHTAAESPSEPDLAGVLVDTEDNTGEKDVYSADTEDNKDDNSEMRKVLETYQWRLPIDEWSALKFTGNNYRLGRYGEGGEPFCYGTYEIDGLRIKINYPDNIEEWNLKYEFNQRIFEWMFPSENAAEFIYDEDYVDFYVTSCLRNGDKVLKNPALGSPAGEKYMLDGIEVIKYNERESHIIVLENLRMRERPDINAPTVDLYVYLTGFDKSFKGHILHRDSLNSFDAITIKEDTINGITAPWYHVSVVLGEV